MKSQQSRARRMVAFLLLGLLIAGCGQGADSGPTPAAPDETVFDPVINATGVVVPQTWARLSVGGNGAIASLPAQEGEQVAEGDVLLSLDSAPVLRAAVAAARLEQVNAQNDLDEVLETADLNRALAQQELAAAQDALSDAEYTYRVRQKGNRASPETLRAAEAKLVLAQDGLDSAKAAYDRLSGRSSDDPARALALRRWDNARQSRDSALRALNWYKGEPTDIEQAQLSADVAVAQGRVEQAELVLQRMEDGPDSRALALAQARVDNAEAQLVAAQSALADSEIRAPFSGTVGSVLVRQNEWVTMGTPAIELGDLEHLQIETTDLNEIDAARVHVGDTVAVTFDATPDFTGEGRVLSIAPKSSGTGGTNYTATIGLDGIPEVIRWGMTAFVDIQVSE
jgi:multidrug efflux pump subunit AcrA (membrane-fusion protein)